MVRGWYSTLNPLFVVLLLTLEVGLWGQAGPASVTGHVSILDFGGSGDGITDNTPAFNAAIAAAMPKALTIFFPCGTFRFASRPNVLGSGIKIMGCGSTGSTIGFGSSLVADYDELSSENAFLTWDGSFGSCCAGTGGGIEKVTIYRGASRSGGTAIKVTGISDGHRAGFSTISDVLVGSVGEGTWDHDLIIDGTCCTTPGAQGVRDTYINNFWATQATAPDESILLRSAVQVFWHGGEVAPARLGSNCGMTITGGAELTQQSVNIFISDVYVAGNLTMDHAKTVSYRGYVGGNVTIDKTSQTVTLGGIVGGRLNNHSSSAMIETNQLVTLPAGNKAILSSLATGTPASTDLAGQLRLTGGIASFKFSHAYSSSPVCVVQDVTAPRGIALSVSNVGFSVNGNGSDLVSFICIARN